MPAPIVAAGITAAGAVGSSLIGASAANSAAKKQSKAAKKAAKIQQDALNQQLALSKPYVNAGTNALAQYQKLAPYKDFGMAQFKADPGYQFRLSEGLKAIERSAAAKGLLQSGGTLKGIEQYGQNLASDEYQNAFGRYLTEREARMNPYSFLIGIGQGAAAGQASNIGATGANLAEIALAKGNAQAAGTMGAVNALSQGFGSAANTLSSYYMNEPYMNYLSSITPSNSVY